MKNKIILILYCFLNVVYYSNAKNYYVKTDGSPTLSGSSWGWASNDLQATINKAQPGDVIYVAAGTYYGGFIMKEGVAVMGRYTANMNNPTERYAIGDTEISHQSILDGEGKERVLTQTLPFTTPTYWDGFVIQNGQPAIEFKIGSIIYSQTSDNNISGILYQYDAESKTGKMIGIEEMRKQWGGYGQNINTLPSLINRAEAKANTSGVENTSEIVSTLAQNSVDFSTTDYTMSGNYAAYWCDTLSTGGYSDWYLPAPGELQKIYDADLRTILESVGKDLKYPYWTSGHIGNELAWAYCFGSGYCHPALKYITYTVSAVHDFSEPETPNGIYFAGGGVFIYSNGIIENCVVKNNSSQSKGGGVYCNGGQIINCNVEGNNAPEGKEIYYENITKNDETKFQDFKIYPNPVKAGNSINIDIPGNEYYDYKIVNIRGKIIDSGTTNASKTIAAPDKQGVYILYIQKKNNHYSAKITIN